LVNRVALGNVGIVVAMVERRAAKALLTNFSILQVARLMSCREAERLIFRNGRKPVPGPPSGCRRLASRTRP
jgi:hypothetical protein